MKKEKTYNEAVDGDEGFVPGEGYPSCDGEPCANVSDDSQDGTDTMADAAEGGDKAGAGSDLTAALAEWQDKFIRLQAEFDNYRKRTLKEKMDLVQTGGRDVLLAMLPVRDDVQRAVDAMQKSDDIEALRAGVTLISQKFTDTLRQKGVTEIDVKGGSSTPTSARRWLNSLPGRKCRARSSTLSRRVICWATRCCVSQKLL